MPTDPKELDEKQLNEILKTLDQPEDTVFKEAALERAVANIQKIGRVEGDPDVPSIENQFVHLAQGHRLGDFVIEKKITQGGMGVIYSAIQEPIGRHVALKTIIPGRANALTLERFIREREILGELHESNIVSIFAAGTQGEIEYFAMPYIAGLPIRQLLQHIRVSQAPERLQDVVTELISKPARGQIDRQLTESDLLIANNDRWRPPKSYFEEVVQLVIDLAAGVQAVHDAGYIHRDITPNNVLVDTNGRPWLIDFGIAASIPADAKSVHSPGIYAQSIDGQLGTPRYKAPELKENMAGRQTDVFGIGVCFYCLLTANEFSNDEYIDEHASNDQLFNSSIPRALAAVCQKTLKIDPAERYQSPHELTNDLQRWLRNEPVSSRAYPRRERVALWLKRNPVKSLSAVAAFLVLGVLSYALIQQANARVLEQETRVLEQETRLKDLRTLVLTGKIDEAVRFVSEDTETLLSSAETNPDLFFSIVKGLIWLGETDEAEKHIKAARASNPESRFSARLTLTEAELKTGFDFAEAKSLATAAKASGYLNEIETHLADALCATESLTEQEHLLAVVTEDPFQLRAQQLLVLNYLFLGQKAKAQEQISNAKMLFRTDLILNIADALLSGLDGNRDQAAAILGQLKDGQTVGVQTLFDSIVKALPDSANLRSTNDYVVTKEADQFLSGLYELQPALAAEGMFVFPPALFNALTAIGKTEQELAALNDASEYWPRFEQALYSFCQSHPEGVFVYTLARAIRSQQTQDGVTREGWLRAEESLERALNTGSIIPIRPILIQELTLTRAEIFFHRSGESDEAKQKLREALRLFAAEGRMPNESRLLAIVVESALKVEDFDLAANVAEHWREAFPEEASAYGYSGRVAKFQGDYLMAYQWSSKAIELAPNHQFIKVHRETRDEAADVIREVVKNIGDED